MKIELKQPKVDIDLANINHFISPESEEGGEFNLLMQGIKNKLFSADLEQKGLVAQFDFDFYIQDTHDKSIARIISAEHKMNPSDMSGKKFAIMFNKEKLAKINTQDELAFVMGHEISHVLWYNQADKLFDQHNLEEVACDLNAIELMSAAGFNTRVVAQMKDKEQALTGEQVLRKQECAQKLLSSFSYAAPSEFDGSKFGKASFVPMQHQFEKPQAEDSEEVAIEQMLRNLDKVFRYGGQDGLKDLLHSYSEEIGSEKASRFFLNLAAAASEKFPPIDEVKKNCDFRKHLRHPINSLGQIAIDISNLSGKKMYPPKAVAKLNSYFKENSNYYQGMDFVWKKWLTPNSPIGEKSHSR